MQKRALTAHDFWFVLTFAWAKLGQDIASVPVLMSK